RSKGHFIYSSMTSDRHVSVHSGPVSFDQDPSAPIHSDPDPSGPVPFGPNSRPFVPFAVPDPFRVQRHIKT
ncbi:hypothetical protein AVEN_52492-1, partial [Araneus ventricosus]